MQRRCWRRGGGGGGRQQQDNDDVRPSSSCYYRPLPVPTRCRAGTMTRTTWRCCTGGGWKSAMPTPTAPMRWWGVVIDKLIPSLFSVDIIIFTSTKSKSEHSDSPWCEPITPLFLEIVRLSEDKKHACGRSIIHTWWGGQKKGTTTKKQNRV